MELTTLILITTSLITTSIIVLFIAYASLITLLGSRNSKRFEDVGEGVGYYPEVSVLIPVKDEAEVLKESLNSILSINYSLDRLRVYVGVDYRCSKCLDVCNSFKDRLSIECVVTYGSKPSVLNVLLKHVSTEYILLLDCDTILSPNSLIKTLSPLNIEGVVGATGIPRPNNLCSGLIPKYFLVECKLWYDVTKAKDVLGLLVQAPGYYSLLNRRYVGLVGGWDELLAEDNDLTLRIYSAGGRIKLVDAEVYIESPVRVSTLIKQRVRWYRGTLEVLIKRWGLLSRLSLKLRVDVFMTYASPILPALLIPALISNTLLGGVFNLVSLALILPQILTPLITARELDLITRFKLSLLVLPYLIINSLASIIAITTLLLGVRIGWWRSEKVGVRCTT